SVRLKLEKTNVRYLSPEERADLARLIFEMEDEARDDSLRYVTSTGTIRQCPMNQTLEACLT
ncbi:hypothetical protein ACYCIS_27575, partial [Klebsiella pneumoniae]